MSLSSLKNTHFLILVLFISCANLSQTENESASKQKEEKKKVIVSAAVEELLLGANRTEEYIPLLENKRVAVVGNPSSLILKNVLPDGQKEYTHLVDSLISRNINVVKVFSPEHGFRGTADAGEKVNDGKDPKTGLEIVSLYGNNKKPKPDQLANIDILIFDIQDVGVRFYTYIATLHYIMEAAAENAIPVIILDRPDPNGHYVDGPIMEKEHTSFLGMHAGVPLVHGMTIGEYAQMINGEKWLKNGIKTDLTVIPMENYKHDLMYSLPVRPSPNLPNDKSINLYPSLGLLEGTSLNAGRGTDMQFQVIGSPYLPAEKYDFIYTPHSNFGSKNPKHDGEICHGIDLRQALWMSSVDLTWIIDVYHNHSKKEDFFNTKNFTAHAGTAQLQKQIESGKSMAEIRESWKAGLDAFKEKRENYLIYE
ncbi:exo-beta-N-acetylmuramidase NamZ domain-containing protein [Flavimarina sp. Hel_I_48]|uniref:exo-beta-N-acetylmuramidase NamZ family protein n=1 Tax=Flavimarina sp. Hel_I_48 TaxID=1392488 RepID=UPI0004DF7C98|nr:DUF1343 domain-containing protein [Flavimarina sp. Hel_I_48]